jgi:type VI secretion system protein ImpI
MFIGLRIDNVDRLPDGTPPVFRAQGRSFEIGREGGDWVLPDPDKFISGRHCQIRYENGGYWLHDVSRNGTFVNGSDQRVAGPYRLANGDRLRIGRYIVSVRIGDQPSPAVANHRGQPLPPAGVEYRAERAAAPSAPLFFDGGGFAGQPPAAARQGGQQLRIHASAPQARAAAARPATSRQPLEADQLLQAIAAGAGIPADVLMQRDAREVATEIGSVLRVVVDELAVLLKARAAAKVLARSGDRTMVGSADNNPLKFVPGSEEILDIMFSRRRTGYLDARHSIEEAFRDLKTHEIATYAAMQSALSRLVEELSPDAIEKRLAASSFASKKGRAWDAFVAIWEAKEQAHENGMLDVFLAYFSEAYAKAAKPK